jgi:predicted dehydrogenase
VIAVKRKQTTRREFVTATGKLAMGAMIVPRRVLGGVGYQAPSDTLNIAIVGAGGMGAENAQELGTENIVAVCDVDFDLVARRAEERTRDDDGNPREKGLRWREQFSDATRYSDYRDMLDRQSDIDAVLIATPDHAHAAIAKAAMEEGKHVYVQKPLTWSVREARMLRDLARETGVVTQMGNQGHSGDDGWLVLEWVQAGVIGPVREVHVWTNRPIWKQGLPAPVPPDEMPDDDNWWPGAVNSRIAQAISGEYRKPSNLDWNLYLGPIADNVEYHPSYHPFHWRGWVPFGVGAIGDMGAHLIDHAYWALGLEYPISIEATSSPWGGPAEAPAQYPSAMVAHYEFPRRGLQPPVTMHWYDGGLMPKRSEHLPEDVELDRTGGAILVGERGIVMYETYGRNPQIFPESLREEAEAVPRSYARIAESHEMNWVLACKGETTASAPFRYAGPLTEVMLLGIVALRAGQGRKILYDGETGRITNADDANRYLTREYRSGWGMTG